MTKKIFLLTSLAMSMFFAQGQMGDTFVYEYIAVNSASTEHASNEWSIISDRNETNQTMDDSTSSFENHSPANEKTALVVNTGGKYNVWDFAGEQLDTALYNNMLTDEMINDWYDVSITVGSSGNVLPSSFIADELSWVGGGNDRLRTTNNNLTRYDGNIANSAGYSGRIYVNSAAATNRYLSIALEEDDELTIITKTDSGGELNFEYTADPDYQTDVVETTSELTELSFVAKQAGDYRIFDTEGKPSYFRILRKSAEYSSLTGVIDTSLAPGIAMDYAVVFTNAAGKSWTANTTGDNYDVALPIGYSYELSLVNANGYIISSGTSLEITEMTTSFNLSIIKVDLFTLSGAITGLGSLISEVSLNYTPDPSAGLIYNPTPIIDVNTGAYTVDLEPNVEYVISAEGVNDYFIADSSITIGNMNTTAALAFSPKPVYQISMDVIGLSIDQLDVLNLTFSNINEPGYTYSFTDLSTIELRDGTYTIDYDGIDAYPLDLALTSNLIVEGADKNKTITFQPVSFWGFDDRVISNGDPTYKGLLFTGSVANQISSSHLAANDGSTIQVPVSPGQTVLLSYYYTADFSIDGGTAITTNTQSTSILEEVEYEYLGTDIGYVTLTMGASASTTYFTDIEIFTAVPFTASLSVGVDKDYQSINAALDAICRMERPNDERVTILIDPGNYEEMLVIDKHNITLKNAAASPSIDLINEGVDIDPAAVRVTAYYGHGYDYYSMGDDQKWNADILQVNKENGYLSYENNGAGTTNGSYWNATVVVYANGFEADDIIFENSFNQYISEKEANDVVVEWTVGGQGLRPTDVGNTEVQNRSFVERAAAIAVVDGADKMILNKCRVIGRQDSFFGGGDSRVAIYKGVVMGAVDYIFGAMTAVFYKTDLAMNTSDSNNDQAYITAAQQSGGRGFLMYECKVTTAIPGSETASVNRSKPGYYGRPWLATTSEVVFYNTNIETSDYPGFEGLSLIRPLGWQNTLGGESNRMYEYGTLEESGENNIPFRASWSTILTDPQLTDGTDITTFNFTKGDDGWDPFPDLIANDIVGTSNLSPETRVEVHAFGNQIFISNVKSETSINLYNLNGTRVKTMDVHADTSFHYNNGFWIVEVIAEDGRKGVKVSLN